MRDEKLETYVLSSAMLDPKCAIAVCNQAEEIFTVPKYRELRNVLASLVERKVDISLVTIRIDSPEAAATAAALNLDFMQSSRQWRSALEKLVAMYVDREMIHAIEASKNVCTDMGAMAARSFLDTTMRNIQNKMRMPAVSLGDYEVEEVYAPAKYVPSCIEEFDEKAAGFVHGLTIIGGRPSVGKTAVALAAMIRMAQRGERPLFFSMEMPRKDLAKRALAAAAKVNLFNLMRGQLSEEERRRCEMHWPAVKKALENIRVREGVIGLDDFLLTTRQEIEMNGVTCVFGDHIGLFRMPNNDMQRYLQIREITRETKAFAMAYDIPAILLSQLRRPENEDREPSLHDLKESGAIEEDADTVLLLHSSPTMRENHQMRMILGKNRNGPTGAMYVTFIRKHMQFGPWCGAGYAENQN